MEHTDNLSSNCSALFAERGVYTLIAIYSEFDFAHFNYKFLIICFSMSVKHVQDLTVGILNMKLSYKTWNQN